MDAGEIDNDGKWITFVELSEARGISLPSARKLVRHRVAATQALLDRAWGRPLQMLAADPERPLLIDFQWSDAAPAAHTDTCAVRNIGDATESAIIDAVVEEL
jgi:hypothetical protein